MGNKCQGKAGIFIFREGDGDLVCHHLIMLYWFLFLQITKIFHIITLDGYGCHSDRTYNDLQQGPVFKHVGLHSLLYSKMSFSHERGIAGHGELASCDSQ